ncbi:MAG: hypothetical protein B7Z75_03645 [Acidocella sp. 20-57-95]|nr:MAG: hypothetical protein B7Z75_03645 [Acidocella sp. 20-57-95]OYV60067.1 MAG: hypothetical protein B7Z71_06870 [Acidocella sp. 21-58-7]HQT63980.1 ATP-binding protein [Acidocella sp.]HQU04260.1 ATP-binding protein [Acidocella sp.]
MTGLASGPDILRITSALSELSRLYPWFAEAAARHSLPSALVQKMHVVLEESVMNVAMHAYAPGSQEEITIRLHAQTGMAELVVEDHGPAFDPVAAPEKPRAESLLDAEIGGLGLRLVRRFCKDISYARVDGTNQLTLRFAYEPETA